jgi:glycosyltransferase involved in cell wall biosynthesis
MISAVVLTKNEEKNIEDCLKSLSWCDETIVIDDNSTDKTVEIAKKSGAKTFTHSLNDDFSAQRNFALKQAKGDWVLFVDADEIVSSALWYEIMATTNDPRSEYSGFYLLRKDIMWGKELNYGETGNIKLLRLAKKDTGSWVGKVHETWIVKGKTKTLKNPLTHQPHQTVKEFLQEINYYTDLRAQELHNKKVKVFWWGITLYPKAKFIQNYFLKLGFLDGLPGLVIAFLMSFHSFLVRGKLWLLWQKTADKSP